MKNKVEQIYIGINLSLFEYRMDTVSWFTFWDFSNQSTNQIPHCSLKTRYMEHSQSLNLF